MNRLVFAFALVACTNLFGPTTGAYPPNTVQFSPLDSFPQYAEWWGKVETCSGIRFPFSELNWFVVKGAFNFEHGGQSVYGYFTVPMNIVLADVALDQEAEVEHEMLHAALYKGFGTKYYTAKDAHPSEYFRTRCPFVAQNPGGG
jgi:hypothetical protein